jgi:hypothetical protein
VSANRHSRRSTLAVVIATASVALIGAIGMSACGRGTGGRDTVSVRDTAGMAPGMKTDGSSVPAARSDTATRDSASRNGNPGVQSGGPVKH